MNYERINWKNGATPINETNLNKMDQAVYRLAQELEKLKQLEVLSTFPNLSNSRIENSVNFCDTKDYSLTYGTLSTVNGKLIVTNTDYASTQLSAKLKQSVVLDSDKNILVKVRIKAVYGSNVCIYPKIGLADGTSVFVVADSILGSNLTASTTYPQYPLPDNKWVDVWFIFGSDISTEVKSIDLHIAPYAVVEIASFQAFYSLDKNAESTVTTINNGVTEVLATPAITPTTYEEVEI